MRDEFKGDGVSKRIDTYRPNVGIPIEFWAASKWGRCPAF